MSEKNPAEANSSNSGVASAPSGATTSAPTFGENNGGTSQSGELHDVAATVEGVSLDSARLIPVAEDEASNSYSMLEPRM